MVLADPATLTGAQRAAVLVVALGVEAASQLLPALDDDEVERVSVEVARMSRVPGLLVDDVLAQFQASASAAPPPGAEGGLEAARSLLRGGLEASRADALVPRMEAATEGTGFDLASASPCAELAEFLAGEHPQTAAVVLSRLPARCAADALAELPADTRADVIRRLSTLAPPPASALVPLDAALRQRFGPKPAAGPTGVKRAADILMQSGRATGRGVLDDLQARTPELATEIESLLFVFEDLARLDDRDLARVLSEADASCLARALSGADGTLSERLFGCISDRVAGSIREEMEMAGDVSASDVEDAQRTVVGSVLTLAEGGHITLVDSAPTQ